MQLAGALQTMDFARARRTMVDCQLRTFDITDAAVLAAFEAVPREDYVEPAQRSLAYSDAALRAGARTLLTPMVLGRMLQGAALKAGDRALDIGGGGYSAAILARLVARVTRLDDSAPAVPPPAGVVAVIGPLEKGWAAGAPYDVILVNGAVEDGFRPLFDQLAPGGRLVAEVRESGHAGRAARVIRFDRLENGVIGEKWLFDAAAETLPAFRRAPAFVF